MEVDVALHHEIFELVEVIHREEGMEDRLVGQTVLLGNCRRKFLQVRDVVHDQHRRGVPSYTDVR